MFFELYEYYGKDNFKILNTEYDTYPYYHNDIIAGELNIIYFDIKIYGTYLFIAFHQEASQGWFIKCGDDIFSGTSIDEFLDRVKYFVPLYIEE